VLTVLVPVIVLTAGLAAGVMMWTQLGGWPLMSSLPPEGYVYTHRFLATRFDPFMPVCLLITAAGAATSAVLADAVLTRTLFGLVALLSVTTITISILKNVPVNRWMQTLDPARPPADLTSVRRRWGDWNRIRAVLSVAAFALTCAALTTLL
jgi:uncharacterized membrane protein